MIKINDVSYDAKVVLALDGTMSIAFEGTSSTLTDIENLFNTNPKIEIWENDELTATYFNKEITSINAKKVGDLYDITIYLAVSRLEESAEKVIQTQIQNILESIDIINENNVATDSAVDELGTVASESVTTIEELSLAIDDLATLVAELVAEKETTFPDEVETTEEVESSVEEIKESTDTDEEAQNG